MFLWIFTPKSSNEIINSPKVTKFIYTRISKSEHISNHYQFENAYKKFEFAENTKRTWKLASLNWSICSSSPFLEANYTNKFSNINWIRIGNNTITMTMMMMRKTLSEKSPAKNVVESAIRAIFDFESLRAQFPQIIKEIALARSTLREQIALRCIWN